ncbi:hypothetical protein DPMN_130925 [Dreissena polymorpha]|uniref:Uncharacterized protein n=1 Tax=Dreissena polymorpha TaxID=45954 RepID=A0A9D4H5K1_DREPO|nr:hypothetical protein DPMN_130925 [Dreissena polymorpha]
MKVTLAALCLVVAIGCVWGQGFPGQASSGGAADSGAGGSSAQALQALAASRGRGGPGGMNLGALMLMGELGSDRMRMFYFCQQNIWMCMMIQGDFV